MGEHDHDHDDDHDHDAHHDTVTTTATTAAVGPSPTGFTIRLVLTLAGAALMVLSAFLDWVETLTGLEFGVAVFWSIEPAQDPNFLASAGFVAIVLGLLAILGLAPRSGTLTSLAGALGIIAFVLFVITIYRAPGDFGVGDVAIGGWALLVGGLVALIGGFFGPRPVTVVQTTAT